MNTNIIIIGGNKKVISLIEKIHSLKHVNLLCVCDSSKNSPGMEFAEKLGIPTSLDFAKYILNTKVDLIIEASGSKEFQKVLCDITSKEVKVIDSQAAELIFDLAYEKKR